MTNFVKTAQRLLPFCIKHIMKQTHLLLQWCFWGEAIDLLLPPVWLQPLTLGEWLVHVLLLPSSLLIGERGLWVESVLRREEVSASLFQIPRDFLKEVGSPEW